MPSRTSFVALANRFFLLEKARLLAKAGLLGSADREKSFVMGVAGGKMLRITPAISIPDGELEFTFARSSGPGGQNVNKVNTQVQLRFDVSNSPSLSRYVKQRLMTLAGQRLTRDGVLVITCDRSRSQILNRQECVQRLRELIVRAAKPVKARRTTHPTRASRQRRLERKRRHSVRKQQRRARFDP